MGAERLEVLSGGMAAEHIVLEAELVLGRDEDGPGGLWGDTQLSRRHARIERTAHGHLLIEDLGSTNGTRVNGKFITGPRVLRDGDEIEVGKTKLKLVADPEATTRRAVPAREPPTAAAAAEPPPPPPRREAAPPAFVPPERAGHPAVESGRGRRGLLLGLGAVAAVAAIALIVVLLVGGGGGGSATGGATVASDCGANLGGGESVGFVSYVESNVAEADGNSVIAMPYRAGDMKPLPASQCATGGSGSADLTDSGVLDADNQVLVNPQHTLLFAVNQGSDTIAVLQIQPNGGLKPAPGSPFPSGGKAPASLGLSGNTLVVANKAQDGIRDLSAVDPNYTTFTVADDGQLTQVSNSNVVAKPGSSPTDAYVPPEGGVAFATEESGPLRGFNISSSGALRQADNSPLDPDPAIFGSGFDPAKEFGLGIAAHPRLRLVYIGMPTVPSIAVYSYGASGGLSYLNSVAVRGGYLPCWIVVTPNAHWMYAVNADTNDVTAFDLSNPLRPKQIQTLSFEQAGNPWNTALDPSGHFLFVNAPRDTYKVPPGEGNIQHVMRVAPNGRLTEVPNSPARIPVPDGVNPQGVAVVSITG